ncbi:MAG: DUF4255 domain-containing protein [Rhodocyclaceae bacterium]|nr:DUF4255 domain-containing protein [Rhodocyclaceae bacterium]
MSTALAIAGVTAVLRDRLNDGLVNHNVAGITGSTVHVTVAAPDRVVPAEGTESSGLNLFLYQVTPHAGWRNERLPSHDGSGRHRLSNPPLALDLHYLISAYSEGDLHAEILLGYAMQLMHEFPVISRESIRRALNPSPDVGIVLPSTLQALADCGLADQLELLRITPAALDTEAASRLWTATQASLRPSAAYQVSVVLIEARQATRPSLPVLTRGEVDPVSGRERGIVVQPKMLPPLPTLSAVTPAAGQPVMRVGETVVLSGHRLDGGGREVRLANDRFDIETVVAASGTSDPQRIELLIPASRSDEFPVGVYEVSARLVPDGETQTRETNRLGAVLAPDITNLPQSVAIVGGSAQLTLQFTPGLRAGQRASLLLGSREIAPQPYTAPTTSLDFVISDAAAGDYPTRLRIDGIDSPIIDRSAQPPRFLDTTVTIT